MLSFTGKLLPSTVGSGEIVRSVVKLISNSELEEVDVSAKNGVFLKKLLF
jgi:hypothetical protein